MSNKSNFNNFTRVTNYLKMNKGDGKSEVLKINKYTTKKWIVGLFIVFATAVILSIIAITKKDGDSTDINCPAVENFSQKEEEELVNEIVNEIKAIKATQLAHQNSQPTSYTVKNITSPVAYAHQQGSYYAHGPLINKQFNGMVLDRSSTTLGDAPLSLIKSDGFISATQTWSYETDGTIRNKFDKVNNKLGSCLLAQKNGNVVLGAGKGKCSTWMWDTKGKLKLTDEPDPKSTTQKKSQCLKPIKLDNGNLSVGLDNCQDQSSEQLWTFHSAPA
jgi:hypothetical protein